MTDFLLNSHMTDILLENYVFKKLRDKCIQIFEINTCYNFSSPGLIWLCELKYTGFRFKYLNEEIVNIHLSRYKTLEQFHIAYKNPL